MSQEIEYPPVLNGLDYLESVVEHLQGSPSARNLKYAVLHLHAAVEVLLKVRLIREDWSLVFRNPGKANRGNFKSGSFHSVGPEEALDRLEEIGIELPSGGRVSLGRLEKERHKLQHFGLESQAIAIESLVGEVLDALLCFLVDHLKPGADQEESNALDKTHDLIQDEMERIETLVNARLARIKPELDRDAQYIITCPVCKQLALLLDGSARCRFCDRVWDDINDLAEEYAESVLNISWYDVRDGAEHPIRVCPDCGCETFLDEVVTRHEPENSCWLCLTCGMRAEQDEIRPCGSCGEPMLIDDEHSATCPVCWAEVINRE